MKAMVKDVAMDLWNGNVIIYDVGQVPTSGNRRFYVIRRNTNFSSS